METRPVGAELFLADGERDRQTDRHDEVNSYPANVENRVSSY